jgi:hypothetical protein
VKVRRSFTLSVAVVGASTTVTVATGVISIAIETALDGAATGVAVTVTMLGDGAIVGAVKVAVAPEPATLIVPQDEPEHPVPETAQEIARFGFELGTGVSVAVRPALVPTVTDEGPLTVKVKLLVTVTTAVAFFDGSATLLAVTVSIGGTGRFCGAVKIPLEVIAPHVSPAQPCPLSAQMIPMLGFPAETMPASKICWAPNSVEALGGDSVTLTSLMIVIVTSPFLVESAALAA